MSKASATGQIVVTSNGTTLHTILQCTLGDLYQNYDGSWDSPAKVSPDFEATGITKPSLVFQAFSAESGGLFSLKNTTTVWEVAGVKLAFNDKGVSTTSFNGTSGHFEKSTDDTDGTPRLTVVKNIVDVNSGNSFNITCRVTASIGNTARELVASFPVYIAPGTGRGVRVHIEPTSLDTLFAITEKGGSCKVKAVVTNDTDIISDTSGYLFDWYLPGDDGEWIVKQSGASAEFTVNEADIDSSTMVKVWARKDGEEGATDVQTINDVSDDYVLYPNPTDGNNNPVAENFVEGSGGKIVYVPFLCERGSNTHLSGVQFTMNLYTTVGVSIDSAVTASDNNTKFTILEETVRTYKGVQYIITGTQTTT